MAKETKCRRYMTVCTACDFLTLDTVYEILYGCSKNNETHVKEETYTSRNVGNNCIHRLEQLVIKDEYDKCRGITRYRVMRIKELTALKKKYELIVSTYTKKIKSTEKEIRTLTLKNNKEEVS